MMKKIISCSIAIAALSGGCTTVKPKISAENYEACKHLCKPNKGALYIASVIEISYSGSINVVSEECACHNAMTFSIIESQQ